MPVAVQPGSTHATLACWGCAAVLIEPIFLPCPVLCLGAGHDIETTPSSPGGNAYSVNRYQPRGGVWGPYHGVNGLSGK